MDKTPLDFEKNLSLAEINGKAPPWKLKKLMKMMINKI